MKYKVIKEFSITNNTTKKIDTLKVGLILVAGSIVDFDIIKNNPEYFEEYNWKSELTYYLKLNKFPQPAILSKKLQPFIIDTFLKEGQISIETDDLQYLLDIANIYSSKGVKDPEIKRIADKYKHL
jgi:hypothetical protein